MTTPFRVRRSFRYAIALAAILLATSFDEAQAWQKPLKVYILAGQSNMQGHARTSTLPHIGMELRTRPMLQKIQNENGEARIHKNVWVSYLSAKGTKNGFLSTGFGADENKIGPELMFGITVSEQLGEKVLIIKAAWGGKSIHTDFRSPSAGPYAFTQAQLERLQKKDADIEKVKSEKDAATGKYYRLMIEHIKASLAESSNLFANEEHNGFELAGFVWFQGWNDMVDSGVYPKRNEQGGYDDYTTCLAHFIRDVRTDLDAPELPFVIGVMGVGGPTNNYDKVSQRYKATHQNFRDAMSAVAAQAEFKGNVFNVLTENCWDQELAALSKRKSKIDGKIRQLQRKGNVSKEEIDSIRKKLTEEEFSADELNILETGKSNAEFHYLGSSKIMACIGREFAKALLQD